MINNKLKNLYEEYDERWGFKSEKYFTVWEMIIISFVTLIYSIFTFREGFSLLVIKKETVRGILMSGLPTLLLLESSMLKARDKTNKTWIVFLILSVFIHVYAVLNIFIKSDSSIIKAILINDVVMLIFRSITNALGVKTYGTIDYKRGGPLELICESLFIWIFIVAIIVMAILLVIGLLSDGSNDGSHTSQTSKAWEYVHYDAMSELIDKGSGFTLYYNENEQTINRTNYHAIAKFEHKEIKCIYDQLNNKLITPSGIEYEYYLNGSSEGKVGNRLNYTEMR